MFVSENEQKEFESFISGWQVDGLGVKSAFVGFKDILTRNKNSRMSFHVRPGITISLRGHIATDHGEEGPLYAMIDVIDDDPEQRWLSVCFYGARISDPEERGDEVPGGLMGEDAICFDYDGEDAELLKYIENRIAESHASCLAAAPS